MRVLIVSIHYRPEVTAIGPYTVGLAEHLASRGDDVTVVAGLPHHPDWRIAPGTPRRLWRRSVENGVTVVRCAHYVPPTQSALLRGVYEATFGLTGLIGSLAVDRPDVVIGIVPSLSGGVLARILGRRFGAPYGVLLQDVMGAAATQSGIPGARGVSALIGAAERWVLRGASAVAIVAEAFRPYVLAAGVGESAIHHVPNWSRVAEPSMTVEETRARFGWDDGRQVVLHAGNIGYKQGLEQVVDAARLAHEQGLPIRFVLSGGGNRAEAIRAYAAGLPNIDFLGVQPDGIHASLMAAADVLLLSERASQIDMSLPSKLTSYFASGRPIVAAVPLGGASAKEVGRSGAGVVVEAARPSELLDVLQERRSSRDAVVFQERGRVYAQDVISSESCLNRARAFVDSMTRDRVD